MFAVDLGLLVLRVVTGLTVAAHGINKVFGGGKLPGTARWFESMGLRPGWLHARLAATTEIASGALFALGLLTPLAAAAVVGLMTVAFVVDHRPNGFFIFRKGEGYEYVMVLAAVATSVGATGAGRASIDHAIGFRLDGWWGLIVSLGGGIAGALTLLVASWRPKVTAS